MSLAGETLRRAFEEPSAPLIGLEEEVLLLDPHTLAPAPVAGKLLEQLDGDARFRQELPAAQLEIASTPADAVPEAITELREGRSRLASAADGIALPAVAGMHPFATEGVLNSGSRYEQIAERYGGVARRQLVCGLHVHVAIRPADRALRTYNGLRSHLPLIAALGANAPYYEGRDSGFASVRPRISQLLPRQGIPPAFGSLEELAGALEWGERSGSVPDARQWWWELRLHPHFGTVEVRVPDAQTDLGQTAGVAALVHCLAVRLADGETPRPVPTWQLEESSWTAARYGLEAPLADPFGGERVLARDAVLALVDDLRPIAETLECIEDLENAADLARRNGAERQREVGQAEGAAGLARWLSEQFGGPRG